MTSASLIDGRSLMARLRDLSAIGVSAGGGVTRPAYSDADLEARALVREWMREIGMTVRVDTAGNTFARLNGGDPALPPIVIGSHTDTVPDGGRYDGALGVLAALEVARTIAASDARLNHPLEVVDFQNEEGGIVGSKAAVGRLDAAELSRIAVSGFSLRDGIRRLGGHPERLAECVLAPGSRTAYVELHIEQGRVLERGSAHIGIVEGIVGIWYWEVTFDGVAQHAGTTPMPDRHDALLAAARFVDAVHDIVISVPGRHVGTVGHMAIHPGAANVIPGRVVATLELRDLAEVTVQKLYGMIESRAREIARDTGTTVQLRPTTHVTPAPTHPLIRETIEQAARGLGLETMLLQSGAGHDAQQMAAVCPSGMLFVPSVEGLSHTPRELTADEDCINGANVLLGVVGQLDARAV
ncbi:MAG TPA: M20 family metallo-hydrolase [Gemmatimonadaceae bacterium]